jgi:hypothetical protein
MYRLCTLSPIIPSNKDKRDYPKISQIIHFVLYHLKTAQYLRLSWRWWLRFKSFGMWHCLFTGAVPNISRDCSAFFSSCKETNNFPSIASHSRSLDVLLPSISCPGLQYSVQETSWQVSINGGVQEKINMYVDHGLEVGKSEGIN